MNPKIRPLTEADADAYRVVRLRALTESPDAFGSTAAETAAKVDFAAECRFQPESFILGAFAEGELVGITALRRQTRIKLRHRADLMQVYVDPGYARQGIAKALVKEALRRAFEMPGLKWVELGVRPSNPRARSLYEGLGFEPLVTWPDYFEVDGVSQDQSYMRIRVASS